MMDKRFLHKLFGHLKKQKVRQALPHTQREGMNLLNLIITI